MKIDGPLGFIGLGEMGGGIVARLVGDGYEVVGYDVRPEAIEEAVELGAAPASSPREVAERSRHILICVPSSAEVEDACLGEAGVLHRASEGTVVIDLTSGQPTATRRIAAALAEHGISMLDAPLSGAGGANRAAIAEGALTVMVGGDPELVERYRPIFATFARNIIPVGPLGAGHLTKALNNMLVATYLLATAEVVAIAAKAGLYPKGVLAAIDESSGKNFATGRRFPDFVLKGDYGPGSGGPLKYLDKDIGQALDVARDVGVPALVGHLVQQLVSIGMTELGGESSSTSLAKLYEAWADIELRDQGIDTERT